MKHPAPALTSLPWTSELAALLEAASLAIGRLDARVCASSMAEAWQLRAAWTGYARALQLQSIEIDEIDVYSWGCGHNLPNRARRSSVADDFAGFEPWRSALAAHGRHWREDLPFTPDLPEGFEKAPALLRALEITAQSARATGTVQPWLALPMLLQRLGVTQTPLPCLVGGDKGFRLSTRANEAVVRRLLKALIAAAGVSLTRLDAMEADRRRAIAAIAAERRAGLLPRVLALSQQTPLLAPQRVASRLRISLSGAGKLLARAAALGLLIEVSGRGSWRLYLVLDLAVTFGFANPTRGRPRSDPPALPHDRAIADILEAFDAEMIAFTRQYPTLGSTAGIDGDT